VPRLRVDPPSSLVWRGMPSLPGLRSQATIERHCGWGQSAGRSSWAVRPRWLCPQQQDAAAATNTSLRTLRPLEGVPGLRWRAAGPTYGWSQRVRRCVVDGGTSSRVRAAGLDLDTSLRGFDTSTATCASGDVLRTGRRNQCRDVLGPPVLRLDVKDRCRSPHPVSQPTAPVRLGSASSSFRTRAKAPCGRETLFVRFAAATFAVSTAIRPTLSCACRNAR